MEAQITLWIFNGLLGVGMYFMKLSHDNTKSRIDEQQKQLDLLDSITLKKEDFREFKQDFKEFKQEMRQVVERIANAAGGRKPNE